MNRKYSRRALFILCVLIPTFAGLFLRLRANPKQDFNQVRGIERRTNPVQALNPTIPEYVVYGALFHYLVAIRKQADELEGRGIGASSLRYSHKYGANLNDEEDRILNEIASDCVREVDQQDMLAQEVIAKFKAQFPSGKIPKGEKLPPPPPQLLLLQQERNATILRAKESLRVAFGDEEFNNYADFLSREL